MEYLYMRYNRLKGKVVNAKLASLSDPILHNFQVVINCTGLSARDIVPDSRVFPIRGQIARVIFIFLDIYKALYISPCSSSVSISSFLLLLPQIAHWCRKRQQSETNQKMGSSVLLITTKK
ncbi:unnamed protein product [Parnassius mnemosyne]|uniref:Uncharacterized protein n=1 Tax=Parnassius mnemosyne TaxID=213953 RepID=A0AAV1KF83_9NEOP